MKVFFSTLFLLYLATAGLSAQGINYQAVARDADGNILADQPVTIFFAVYPGGGNDPVFEESHQTTTDAFGQFTLVIGQGDLETGGFNAVDWSAGPHEMGIRLDTGNGPVALGRLPLQGVPYSFFAERAGAVEMTLGELTDVSDNEPADGQILKWNGSSWAPGTDLDADNQSLSVNGNQLSIRGGNTVTLPTGSGGDNWGEQTVQTSTELSGEGTLVSPLTLSGQGAATGQTLKWNGSNWAPADDADTDDQSLSVDGNQLSIQGGNTVTLPDGGDDWGDQTVNTGTELTGEGTSTSPLTLSGQGAANGQTLKWNGSNWVPANDVNTDNQSLSVDGNQLSIQGGNTVTLPDGGDDWGDQTVRTGAELAGEGTPDSPLTLSGQGAGAGQVLKWNGSAWAPQVDEQGPSYSAGNGIAIEDNTIRNTGDTDAGDDLTTGTLAGGDVSGVFSDLTVTGLSGREVADISPGNAQVLAWNGSRSWWQPATINFPSYQAGQGILINDNTIINTGDRDADDDLLKSSVAAGDVTGVFNNLLVSGLRGRPIASQTPLPGQVLKWNGAAWVPDSVRTGSSLWSSNNNKAFYNIGFVGIGTNNPLSKLHLFGGDLLIQDDFPVLTLDGSGANKIISFKSNGQDQGALLYSNGIGLRATAGGDLNTNNWVLSPNGNFGIGINNPQRKLHVHFDNNNGITSPMLISQAGGGDAWMNLGLDGSTHYAVGIDNSDNDKFKISYHPNTARGVGENTRLTIDDAGRVGIGRTDPRVELDVNGALKLGNTAVTDPGIIRWTGTDFLGRKGNQWVSLTETGSNLWSQNASDLFYSGGRVGIGTQDPSRLLTLSRPAQAAQHQLELRNQGNITNGNYDGIIFTQGSVGSTRLASIQVNYKNNGQPDMSLNLRNDNNMIYLEAGGNVGINTSNPGDDLDVNGNVRASGEVRRTSTGSANLVPIAYGNISGNGSINKGTGNFSVSRTAAGAYEITISGESIFFEDYIISANVAGDAGFVSYSSVGGKLLIKTFNLVGVVLAADRSFSFVVYKP